MGVVRYASVQETTGVEYENPKVASYRASSVKVRRARYPLHRRFNDERVLVWVTLDMVLRFQTF